MSSVLDITRATLKQLAGAEDVPMSGVYYGACRDKKLQEWNYFVFNRLKLEKSSNNVDYQTFYEVHVVHEDFIPEGYVEKVIKALETQEGERLKATPDPVTFDYTFKTGTDMVVEIATITLFRPRKRC